MKKQGEAQLTMFEQMVEVAPEAPQAVAPEPIPQGALPEPAPGNQPDDLIPVTMNQFSSKAEFSQDEVYIPRLRLAQGLSPEVQAGAAKPGEWLLTGYEPVATVELIPMMFARVRQLRDPDTFEVYCQSSDSLTGQGDPGGTCAGCDQNRWTGNRENRKPPECSFSFQYIGFSVTHGVTMMMEMKRTALGAGKMLNTIISRHGFSNVAVVLSSKQQTSGRRVYHMPVIAVSSRPLKLVLQALLEAGVQGNPPVG